MSANDISSKIRGIQKRVSALLRDGKAEALPESPLVGELDTIERSLGDLERDIEGLKRSDDDDRRTIEDLPMGIFRTSPDGRILDANPAAVRILGYPDRESLLKVNAAALYADGDDRSKMVELLAREGFLRGHEIKLIRYDGTRNVVAEAVGRRVPMVHISTDYVFWGDVGNYAEDDPVGPVRNYYSLTKLVAESLVRIVQRHLVIRTSFRPREWPYPTAFEDVYTSQDYVDIIAAAIALAIGRFGDIPFDTLHIATERKSAYELACRRKPDVRRGSKRKAGVEFPDDISLDTSRWQELKERWAG